MLTDMKTLLDIAEKKGCAIPAFNVYNAETVPTAGIADGQSKA